MSELDPADGATRWRTPYPARFEMSPATRRHGAGAEVHPRLLGRAAVRPRHDGRGDRVRRRLRRAALAGPRDGREPALPPPPCRRSSATGLVVVHVGGHDDGALTAFDAATGDVRWAWDGDGPAYGSPMLFDLDGVEQVVVFTQEHFVGVRFARPARCSGAAPSPPRPTTTSQTPILHRNLVIQNGRGNGVTAFRAIRDGDRWTTEEAWRTAAVSLHMANPVEADGVMFGLSHLQRGQYFRARPRNRGSALDQRSAPDRKRLPHPRRGHGPVAPGGRRAGGLRGEPATGFAPVRRYRMADTETWAQPAFSGDRIFVKDVSNLTLWTLR